MFAVAYACAEFHDKTGAVIHMIRPADLRITTEMPDAIRQDPLFGMMVKDGTLRATETKSELKKLENDPELFAPDVKIPEPKAEEKVPEPKTSDAKTSKK